MSSVVIDLKAMYEPNDPPNKSGYYWFFDLINRVIDIVAVTETYCCNSGKCLHYVFLNDQYCYKADDLKDDRFHFFYKEIDIPEEIIEYKRNYLNP